MPLYAQSQMRTTRPKIMDTSRTARPPPPLRLWSPATLLQPPAQRRRLKIQRGRSRQSASQRRPRRQASSATARSLSSRRHRNQCRRRPSAPAGALRTRRLPQTQFRRRAHVHWGPMRRCGTRLGSRAVRCDTIGEQVVSAIEFHRVGHGLIHDV
jgi:hypothetical protein